MICYVEDDTNIRDLVVYTLNHSNLPAIGFSEANSFYDFCLKEIPTLILLDIMLPETDGLKILSTIRANKNLVNVPVIMLTAKTGEYNTILGLDSGADDYISKPFSMVELISRINAVLRRTNRTKQTLTEDNDCSLLIYEKLVINKLKHTVEYDKELIELTFKEFELLVFLMENREIVFDREKLLEKVWLYSSTFDTRTIDVHIKSLRNKLKGGAKFIETVRGVGYKFSEGKEK